MNLTEFVAENKRQVYEDLVSGRAPRAGKYDKTRLAQLRAKGAPQMGTTEFEPDSIHLEFIYMSEGVSEGVLSIELQPPERIVFMPVPKWVVEEVWQGEVGGSYHFESDAEKLLEQFSKLLSKSDNKEHFKKRKVIGRS